MRKFDPVRALAWIGLGVVAFVVILFLFVASKAVANPQATERVADGGINEFHVGVVLLLSLIAFQLWRIKLYAIAAIKSNVRLLGRHLPSERTP